MDTPMHPRMKTIQAADLEALRASALRSPRLRMNHNLHAMQDPIHRLLNATEPGTYVRPHRHASPPQAETLVILRGRGAVLRFDDRGEVIEQVLLAPRGPCVVLEVPAGGWHTLLALEPGTLWFEVKPGPYVAPPPEDVAGWAPAADTPEAARYLERLEARFGRAGAASP